VQSAKEHMTSLRQNMKILIVWKYGMVITKIENIMKWTSSDVQNVDCIWKIGLDMFTMKILMKNMLKNMYSSIAQTAVQRWMVKAMADLIDRKSLLIQIEISPQNAFIRNTPLAMDLRKLYSNVIKLAPTVDAVEVVRCWECVHRRKRECPLYNEKYMEYDMGYGDIEQVCKITDGTIDDGFCYKGERRGD